MCESAEAFWALSLPRTLVAPSPRPLSETRDPEPQVSDPPSPQKPQAPRASADSYLAPHQATRVGPLSSFLAEALRCTRLMTSDEHRRRVGRWYPRRQS